MKITITFLIIITSLNVFGQNNLTQEALPIVTEGKLLYQSEMASWYGTDIFLEVYSNRDNIGGYFSYSEDNTNKCIFFSNAANPKVIGTISFDSTFNIQSAKQDLTERDFTSNENDIYQIRKLALEEISSDTMFKQYTNTSLNLIPLLDKKEKKVYVLTGPQQNGVVIFGNDYLLTFDKNNKLLSKKQLHKNIIPITYGGENETGENTFDAMHTHLPETGDFITATDICTLMLYAKFANWKTHNVVSEHYLNMWNCETNQLVVLPKDIFEKIEKEQEKKNKKKGKQKNNE